MILWLVAKGLTPRIAKLIAYVGVPLLILAVLGGSLWYLRHDAYNDGKRDERAVWLAKVEEMKALAEKVQRLADENKRIAEVKDQARIANNRKEVDNATQAIPDQAPSARQLTRACIELRRIGNAPPACDNSPR